MNGNENFESIQLITPDHNTLQGYLYQKPKAQKQPLVLYFGGRGEEASNIVPYAAMIEKGWSLAFMNYRGCGASTGSQSYESLISDARLVYDYFTAREDIDEENIVLVSHSLGTGVAIQLAACRKVSGLVLSCAYDQYVNGVIQDKVPLIPLDWIVQEEYCSIDFIAQIHTPILFLLAQEDQTVKHKRTNKLMQYCQSSEMVSYTVKNVNHETITMNSDTWIRINQFLQQNNNVDKH